MKILRVIFVIAVLCAPFYAQQVNQDIVPASPGLYLGHTNQRWNGYFNNADIYNLTINGSPIGTGGIGLPQISIPNGTNCTTLNGLVEFDGNGQAQTASLSSTKVIGVAVSGAGCSGNVLVQYAAIVNCTTDGSTLINDRIAASNSIPGDCMDIGPISIPGIQTVGLVTAVSSGAGQLTSFDLFTGDTISPSSSSGSGVVSVSPCIGPFGYAATAAAIVSWDCNTSLDGSGNAGFKKVTVTGSGAGKIDFGTSTTPGNPSAGFFRLYADSGTGFLTCLTSTGGNCNPSGSSAFSALTTSTNTTATMTIGNGAILNMAAGGKADFSIGTATNAFKLPTAAGAAPTTAAVLAFDSTATQPVYGDGANTRKIMGLQGSTPATGNCAKFVTIGTSVGLQDFGSACVATSAIPTQVVQSGLLAEYRLTDGSGTNITDSSGNGNTGTFPGGANNPTWTTTGLTFAGNHWVNLPNALYAAQTIQIYFTYQPLTASSQLFPTLFVNSTSQFGIFLWSKAQDYSKAAHDGAYMFRSRTNAGFKTATRAGLVGTGMMTLTMNGTADAFYINGSVVDTAEGTSGPGNASGAMSTGTIQLGGSSTAFGGNTLFTGSIYYVVVYNRALTAAEVQQNYTFVSGVMATRGVPVSLGSSSTANQLVVDGDSITEAQNFGGSFAAWHKDLVLNGTWNITDVGSSGMYISQPGSALPQCEAVSGTTVSSGFCGLQGDAANVVDTVAQTHSPNTGVVIWAGTNDVSSGAVTVAQAVGQLGTYCRQRHLLGEKCIVVTMLSRTTQDANKNSYNALIRSGWPAYADALADVAADANLGADGANASATYFQVDNIHPTSFASHNDIAPVIQRAVNRFFGNTNFSTATTYTTTAAAATATTAGSESTNTVTITFGATPANCLAGSTVTLAGLTPAGYNGTFNILTRTATQITVFNSTTGLGAVTVQGTGVCPQQVDADVYTILGGSASAPNFTLESCVGYTGQNLYFKNTNTSSAWTITPFGTETIDGSASFTLAAASATNNPVIILQAVLVSAAAGGCNWKTLSVPASWQCTNVTPVTVNTNTAADQNMMACAIPAYTLNSVNKTLRIYAAGVYSTPAASTSQMTMKAKLCTVSGCGSGTVITPISIQSTALGTVQITNDNFSMHSNITTQTTGASSAYEAHGEFLIDLATLTTAADSSFGDTNTATVGTIDATAQLFLQMTFAFSNASGSNSATQRQLIVDTVN